ncbi:MAG: hypothetical protein H0V91_09575 [Flavisolibacter sp.]|nr:hypothetical protein [Flavisolibacter sp.]
MEAIGQYNFSNRSALLLKTSFTSWAYQNWALYYRESRRVSFLTIQGGYGYQFGTSGFFINGLAGLDADLHDSFTSVSFTLGAGKRFIVNEDRFLDVGIDFVVADAENRLKIKVLLSLFRLTPRE